MKIYTRTGDDGTTGLLGKARLPKHDARVEAYGSVDELNAVLGVAHAQDGAKIFGELLPGFQAALFQLGAELATVDAAMLAKLTRVGAEHVTALEREIDQFEAELVPLTQFVLPGGAPLAAALHRARGGEPARRPLAQSPRRPAVRDGARRERSRRCRGPGVDAGT
jgi:cob(I)alamin adenosyltransferase